MDVATINSTMKTPMKKADGEQPRSTSQESDPAFVQLLAGLGLIQSIPSALLDAEKLSAVNGEPLHSIDTMPMAQAASSVTTPEQEKSARGKIQDANVLLPESIQPSSKGTTAEDLLAPMLISAGKYECDPTGTTSAQPEAIGKAKIVEGKTPVSVASLPDIKGAVQKAPQATVSNTVREAVLAKLVDVVSSSPASKEGGAASALIPARIGLTLNGAVEPPMAEDMPLKQTSSSTQTVIWNAVMESSNLPESGKGNNSASADHNGDKERFPQAEPNGSQAAPVSASSSFSSQPAAALTKSIAGVEAPTVIAPLESPLSASVRFEVQQGDMGRIRVHLSVVDHTVYTNVMTERIEAHDFLVNGSDRYEAGLAAHGLDVGRFQVDVQGHSREQADRGGTAWSQEQTPRNRAEPTDHATNSLASEWHPEERQVEWDNRMVNVFA